MTSVVIPVIQDPVTSIIPPVVTPVVTQTGNIKTSTDSLLTSNPNPVVPLTASIGASVLSRQGIEKIMITQKIVEFTGATPPSLPKNPNTLLGYDSEGQVITVGIGTGVSLIG